MLKNYFRIAFRNLLKSKTFSFINISGLAAGLACFILIALYVKDELSYDRFNDKADRIYRLHSDIIFGGNNLHAATTADPMGPMLKKDFPQVEEYVRIYASGGSRLIRKNGVFINEPDVAFVDSTFFDVFSFPAIAGDTHTALNEPNTVVITESVAKKYFGSIDVVGKMLEVDDDGLKPFKVTAVIKDMPQNGHFYFDFLFSMDNVHYTFNAYLSHNFFTYLLLKPGTDTRQFEKNLDVYIERYIIPQAQQYMKISSLKDLRTKDLNIKYGMMPLTDIHLRSDRFPELAVNGNIQYVYIFFAVALFVLLLACVNFMNLSTARSAGRAKEVGIRKVLGTERKSLITQFLTESIFTVFIALLFALLLVWMITPWFNDLSGKQFTIQSVFTPVNIVALLVLPVMVGMLAGSYPALYLSSFRPVAVLKGKFGKGFRKSYLRNALVIFQFATSIILIAGTIIVYKQLDFIQHKKLGYKKEQVLVVNNTYSLNDKEKAFKEALSGIPGVTSVTMSGYLPVKDYNRSDNAYSRDAVMNQQNSLSAQTWRIDYDYMQTLGIEVIKGRNFSPDFPSDSSAVIVNETTAKVLGYENPVGHKLYTYFEDPSGKKLVTYDIIGMVKDFHFESLRQTVSPLLFRLAENSGAVTLKISSNDIPGLVNKVRDKWKQFANGMPFDYRFLDDAFNDMYRVEQRTGKLGLSFAIIAILIACLGLFGLAAYMAEQRIREIGVRKVLGASVPGIIAMLSKDFIVLVLVAAVIGIPIAWIAMNKWLQDFAFRIDIGWWVFAAAGIITLVIAILTVSMQALKAALANPVKSLRTE